VSSSSEYFNALNIAIYVVVSGLFILQGLNRKMSTNYSQRHILDFELLFIITSDTEIIARVKDVIFNTALYYID
jgi:hypothetical protein